MHSFGAWARQAVIKTIAMMYKLRKRTQELLSANSTHNTKHFCAQSGGSIHLTIWKWGSGELGYPGALPPKLEDSCCTFSPGPTDSSWVSEDSVHLAWMLKHTVHFWKSVMWELCWVAGTKGPQINTQLIFLKANSKLLTFFFPKHTQILQSELSFAPFTSGMWIHFSTTVVYK